VRLVGRLSRRVLVTSALTGIVAAAVTLVLARGAVGAWINDAIRAGHDAQAQARCVSDPAAWTERGPGDARVFAYDAATLRSHNPAAPPLDIALAGPVAQGERDRVLSRTGTGGTLVFRSAPSGPCSLVAATWSGTYTAGPATQLVASAAVFTALSGALLSLLLVVWPLARRTRALALAANVLGEAHGLTGAPGGGDDELDTALARLRLADARIRRDAEVLRERSTALQRHLGDVAHDVRTPLSALQLTLEHLADEAKDHATRARLAQALCECVSVSNITENLRLQSLVEDGLQPTTRPIRDVARVLERVVFRAQSLGRRTGIAVEMAAPDAPIAIAGDELFLERCVTNLLDNAVRFGDRGGHVALVLARCADTFVITVRDDGPGVTADALARLGERAFRTDEARQRDPRGSGLGLAITRALCDRCGWRLSFVSLEPRGLEVTLRGSILSP
jgi:signal transduction histidine kinase